MCARREIPWKARGEDPGLDPFPLVPRIPMRHGRINSSRHFTMHSPLFPSGLHIGEVSLWMRPSRATVVDLLRAILSPCSSNCNAYEEDSTDLSDIETGPTSDSTVVYLCSTHRPLTGRLHPTYPFCKPPSHLIARYTVQS